MTGSVEEPETACSATPLPERRPAPTVKHSDDDHDISHDAIKDRVRREHRNRAPPNVAVDLAEDVGRFGDQLDRSVHPEKEAERRAGIERVLAVPGRCFVQVVLRGSTDLVLYADWRRGLCFTRRRAITMLPSSSVPASPWSRRSSSSAIHCGREPS